MATKQRNLREEFWERHSNLWSGLTRMVIAPFLYLALWYHSWIGLGIVILWVAINSFVFPEPRKKDGWISQLVLGRGSG